MTPGRRRLVVVGGAAVAILAAGAIGLWIAGPRVSSYLGARSDVIQTVVASGRVESPRRVEIGSPTIGTVVQVPVVEGETVAKGRLLVKLDDAEARAAVESSRSAVDQARARIVQIVKTSAPVAQQAVTQAQANFDNAVRQYGRNHDLFEKGFLGQAALDDAQRARDVAASQLDAAKVQRDTLSASGPDWRMAQTALDQAEASLRMARARLDLLTIEAPVGGTLIQRDVEVGDVVQPGKVLLTLSPGGETQLTVQIDEKNLNHLKIGQKALASADAYPDRRFPAEVVYINPGVDATRGSVEVKLTVPKPPPYLLQDMTISVDIEIARREAVTSIPLDAVHDPGSDSPWVLVVKDGRAERRAVKLGARGGSGLVEILAGLEVGERVIPATESSVLPGRKVRAAA